MKRFAIILFSALFLLIAYASKPDDRTCIIEGIKAVWGRYTPSADVPVYYNQFMDLNSNSIVIKDWVILKQVRYKYNESVTKTVGIGALNRVFILRRSR